MISMLTGQVAYKGLGYIILDVHGVGYKVAVSSDTLSHLKESKGASLHTYLAVRENALDLYGFENTEDLSFFTQLLTVSGIGPKSALGVLDVAPVETLRSAVASGDTTYLTKVSGIGGKTAQKIVLELKDKVTVSPNDTTSTQNDGDVLDALKALGYSAQEARAVLKKIPSNIESTNEKLKEALKQLSS